jgi:HAE1 family hydrophobic/amphiphilic exporter-1
MFGLILATGIVVDDAIVVVEAISVKLDRGMRPRQAAIEAMNELSGAVIATSLALMAVFIPVAFFPGTTGRIYQQFALTIAFAIAISTFNALSFSPAMSAILMRLHQENRGPLSGFWRKFNRGFEWLVRRYTRMVNFLIRIRIAVVGVFVVGIITTAFVYVSVPSGFLPEEDRGVFLGIVQAPDGVSLNYTDRVAEQIDEIMQRIPEISSRFVATGIGFEGNSPARGFFYCTLKNWEERNDSKRTVQALVERINGEFAQKIPNAIVAAFNLPPVKGYRWQCLHSIYG